MKKQLISLIFCLQCSMSFGLPERVLSVDFGVGIPELLSIHAQVQAAKRWQFGFGYTYLPQTGFLGQSYDLDSQSFELADGNTYETTPVVTPTLSLISPFVRYFPGHDNFYFQLSYTQLKINAKVTSTINQEGSTEAIEGALLTGNIVFTQPLPSLAIGYIFSGKLFFFNVTLGAVWVAPIFTTVSLTGVLPEALGGAEGSLDFVDEFRGDLKQQSNELSAQWRSQAPALPYFHLSFGFLL